MSEIDVRYALSPSEIVYLNAERFAKTSRLGYRALAAEGKVNTTDLGRTVVAAAILALEAAGAVMLELEETRRFLLKVRHVRVAPVADGPSFPAPSLEEALRGMALDLASSANTVFVKDILDAWIGEDTEQSFTDLLDVVPGFLADRGLAIRREEKRLKVFTVTDYELPASTRELAADRAPLDAVLALLADCERDRPDLAKQLKREVGQPFASGSGGDGGDFD